MRQMRLGTGFKSRRFFLSSVGLGVFLLAVLIGFWGASTAVAAPAPKWLLEFEEKCESGSMLDCQNAAHTFAKGKYRLKEAYKDKEKVEYYIQRIVQMGEQGCADNAKLKDCHLLGVMYFEGRAINRDVVKGMEIINTSCNAGYDVSCDWLHDRFVR